MRRYLGFGLIALGILGAAALAATTLPKTIAVGGHASDGEIVGVENAVQALLDHDNAQPAVWPATSGGTGQSSYAVGDLLYANSTTTLLRLPIGSSTQVLTVSSGLPSWQPASGGGGGIVSPDTPPASPTIFDDEFTETSLDTTGSRFSGAQAWSWRNQGSATATLTSGLLVLAPTFQNGVNIQAIEQPLGGATGTWVVRLSANIRTSFDGAGIYALNSSTGKLITVAVQANTNTFYCTRFTNTTTFSANPFSMNYAPNGSAVSFTYLYLRLTLDGTNIKVSISPTGVGWLDFYSETYATFLGTPDKIGIYVDTEHTTDDGFRGVFDWFRKTS